MKCKICNSTNTKLNQIHLDQRITDEVSFNEYACLDCGFKFLNLYENKQYYELGAKWDNGNLDYLNNKINLIKKIFPNLKNKKILDIGCASGEFLNCIRKYGAEVEGIEIDSENIQKCIKKEIKVFSGDISNFNTSNRYDIITLWHVIEHINDLEVLKNLNSLLNHDGCVIILTPNFSSLQKIIFQNNWFHYDIPRHVNFFDEKSLKNLLLANSLEIIKIKYNFYIGDCVVGFINSFVRTILYLFAKNKIYKKSRKNKTINYFYNSIVTIFSILCWPIYQFMAILKLSCTILVVAKKI